MLFPVNNCLVYLFRGNAVKTRICCRQELLIRKRWRVLACIQTAWIGIELPICTHGCFVDGVFRSHLTPFQLDYRRSI